ncbi:hypothetical protein ACE0DR_28620 [Azotobacter sp. CWF10]
MAKQGLRDIARQLLQQKLVIPIQTKILESINGMTGQGGGLSLQSIMGLFGGNRRRRRRSEPGTIAGLLSKGQGLFSAGASAASSGASAGSLLGFGNNVAALTGGGAYRSGWFLGGGWAPVQRARPQQRRCRSSAGSLPA